MIADTSGLDKQISETEKKTKKIGDTAEKTSEKIKSSSEKARKKIKENTDESAKGYYLDKTIAFQVAANEEEAIRLAISHVKFEFCSFDSEAPNNEFVKNFECKILK